MEFLSFFKCVYGIHASLKAAIIVFKAINLMLIKSHPYICLVFFSIGNQIVFAWILAGERQLSVNWRDSLTVDGLKKTDILVLYPKISLSAQHGSICSCRLESLHVPPFYAWFNK